MSITKVNGLMRFLF